MKNTIHCFLTCLLLSISSGITYAEEILQQPKSENSSTELGNSMLVIPVGGVNVAWESKKYSGIAGLLGGAIGGGIAGYMENSDPNEIVKNRALLARVVVSENFQPTFGVNLAAKLKSCNIDASGLPYASGPPGAAWIQATTSVTPPDLLAGKTNKYFIETGINYFKVTAGLTSDSLLGYGTAKVFDTATRTLQKKYKEYNGFTQPVNLNHFAIDNPKAAEELQTALRETVEIVSQNIANAICSDYAIK